MTKLSNSEKNWKIKILLSAEKSLLNKKKQLSEMSTAI